ncbi:hypothetical protein D3C87_1883710 [compost metagenome]
MPMRSAFPLITVPPLNAEVVAEGESPHAVYEWLLLADSGLNGGVTRSAGFLYHPANARCSAWHEGCVSEVAGGLFSLLIRPYF